MPPATRNTSTSSRQSSSPAKATKRPRSCKPRNSSGSSSTSSDSDVDNKTNIKRVRTKPPTTTTTTSVHDPEEPVPTTLLAMQSHFHGNPDPKNPQCAVLGSKVFPPKTKFFLYGSVTEYKPGDHMYINDGTSTINLPPFDFKAAPKSLDIYRVEFHMTFDVVYGRTRPIPNVMILSMKICDLPAAVLDPHAPEHFIYFHRHWLHCEKHYSEYCMTKYDHLPHTSPYYIVPVTVKACGFRSRRGTKPTNDEFYIPLKEPESSDDNRDGGNDDDKAKSKRGELKNRLLMQNRLYMTRTVVTQATEDCLYVTDGTEETFLRCNDPEFRRKIQKGSVFQEVGYYEYDRETKELSSELMILTVLKPKANQETPGPATKAHWLKDSLIQKHLTDFERFVKETKVPTNRPVYAEVIRNGIVHKPPAPATTSQGEDKRQGSRTRSNNNNNNGDDDNNTDDDENKLVALPRRATRSQSTTDITYDNWPSPMKQIRNNKKDDNNNNNNNNKSNPPSQNNKKNKTIRDTDESQSGNDDKDNDDDDDDQLADDVMKKKKNARKNALRMDDESDDDDTTIDNTVMDSIITTLCDLQEKQAEHDVIQSTTEEALKQISESVDCTASATEQIWSYQNTIAQKTEEQFVKMTEQIVAQQRDIAELKDIIISLKEQLAHVDRYQRKVAAAMQESHKNITEVAKGQHTILATLAKQSQLLLVPMSRMQEQMIKAEPTMVQSAVVHNNSAITELANDDLLQPTIGINTTTTTTTPADDTNQ